MAKNVFGYGFSNFYCWWKWWAFDIWNWREKSVCLLPSGINITYSWLFLVFLRSPFSGGDLWGLSFALKGGRWSKYLSGCTWVQNTILACTAVSCLDQSSLIIMPWQYSFGLTDVVASDWQEKKSPSTAFISLTLYSRSFLSAVSLVFCSSRNCCLIFWVVRGTYETCMIMKW